MNRTQPFQQPFQQKASVTALPSRRGLAALLLSLSLGLSACGGSTPAKPPIGKPPIGDPVISEPDPKPSPSNCLGSANIANSQNQLGSQHLPSDTRNAEVMVRYSSEAVARAVAHGLQAGQFTAPVAADMLGTQAAAGAEANAGQSSTMQALELPLSAWQEIGRALTEWQGQLGGMAGQNQSKTSAPDLDALAVQQAAAQRVSGVGQSGRWVSVRVAGGAEKAEALAEALGRGVAEKAVVSARLHALQLEQTGWQLQPQTGTVTPTDQYAPNQWAFKVLGFDRVWADIERGGYDKAVTVAVIDSGVRYDHPDLAGRLLGPEEGALDVLGIECNTSGAVTYNNGDGDGPDRDPTDPTSGVRTLVKNSHGTHVSGIIAASWGEFDVPNPSWSRSGVVGAVYKAPIRVLPVRVIDARGDAEIAEVSHAVRYAAGLPVTLEGKTYINPSPATVLNLSLGGVITATQAAPLCDAVAEAKAAGSLAIVAGGNFYNSETVYPAACEGALAVGSSTLAQAGSLDVSNLTHADYSNTYAQIALSAVGGSGPPITTYNGGSFGGKPAPDLILSTDWDFGKNEPIYHYEAGTSQAAPQVSALAALLLSKGVTDGPEATARRMIETATDLGNAGRDPQFGYGVINPPAALGLSD